MTGDETLDAYLAFRPRTRPKLQQEPSTGNFLPGFFQAGILIEILFRIMNIHCENAALETPDIAGTIAQSNRYVAN